MKNRFDKYLVTASNGYLNFIVPFFDSSYSKLIGEKVFIAGRCYLCKNAEKYEGDNINLTVEDISDRSNS